MTELTSVHVLHGQAVQLPGNAGVVRLEAQLEQVAHAAAVELRKAANVSEDF